MMLVLVALSGSRFESPYCRRRAKPYMATWWRVTPGHRTFFQAAIPKYERED